MPNEAGAPHPEVDPDKNLRSLIEPGGSYPVWSPDQAFSAAAVLLRTLEVDAEDERVELQPRSGGSESPGA